MRPDRIVLWPRIFLTLLIATAWLSLVLVWSLPVAQLLPGFDRPLTAYDFEVVTVGGSSVSLTTSKVTPTVGRAADLAQIGVETAQVRCTVNGTTPTASLGHRFYPEERFSVVGNAQVANLKCIRETATSGVIAVTFYRLLE